MPAALPPRGTLIQSSVAGIQGAMRWYLVVLLLTVLTGVISAITIGVSFGGIASLESGQLSTVGSDNSTVVHPLLAGSSALGLSVAEAVAGLMVLILTVVSWSKWRDSVRSLETNSFELGGTYQATASRARAGYDRTVQMFILQIVLAIVLVAILVAIIFSSIAGSLSQNSMPGSGTHLSVTLSKAVLQELLGWVIGAAIAGAVLNFLLYYFATRSHLDVLRPIATPELVARLEQGRRLALVGAAVSPIGALGLLSPYAALAGSLPPLVVVLGYYLIYSAFGSWLARPVSELASVVPRPL